MAEKKHKEIEGLKEELEAIQDRLKKLTESEPEVAGEVKEYVDQASSALKEYVDRTADKVKEKWDSAKGSGVDMGKKAHSYAKENPWQIAAAAALVGMAVASLIHRDKDKD